MKKESKKDVFLVKVDSVALKLMKRQSLSLTALCEELCISRSHLHRKLKVLSGVSTSLYLRKIRVAHAKDLLENTAKTISQVSYEVGVQSPQNFSKYFQLEYNISPTDHRRDFLLKNGNAASDNSNLQESNDRVLKKNSIAILPFENHTSDLKDSHFSDGIAEEILYGLSQLDDLHVAGRASSFYFKSSIDSIGEIGKQLGVEHILTGSVRRKENKVRVMVRLLTTSNGFQVWADRYDRELEDIFDIQEEIAAHIVDKLKVSLIGGVDKQQILKRKTDSIKAYDLYLKGREQFELRSDLDLSLSYFQRATEVDDTFVHAYFGMAYAMLYKCIFAGQRPMDALDKIESSYQKAIDLDPLGAEGHIINGWIKFYFHYDFDGALAAMDLAILADPDSMDAHRIKGYFYAFHGLFVEAIPLAERAYQLDPLGYNAWFSLADIYRRARHYDQAIQLFLPLLPKFPDNALLNEILALSYYHNADLTAADATFANHQELPNKISIWTVGRYIYHYYHGDKRLLVTLLHHLEKLQSDKWIQPTIFSLILFHLGQEDEAIAYLDQAYDERDFGLKHIITEPHWDLFREHPAVVAMLERVL